MISAKSLGIYMFPAVILYFLFKFIRKETKLRDVIKFSLGSLSIGILFVSYQYYFWEFFKVTIQQVSHSVGAGVLTHNLLSILFTIFAINTNGYLINPINVFLLILLLIYLGQIRFLNLFSRQGISYVRGLNSLDITMLSLFFGYIGILFHPGSQRHMNLISVMLSFAPALVLFNNNKFEYFHEKMKWAKIIISLIPLFFLAKETLGFLSPYLRPYIKHPFLISMSASLIALVVLSFSYKYIPHKFKRMLITVSFVSLIFVVNLNTFNYMTEAFSLSIHTKLFLLLFLTLIYSSIFYLIYRNVNFVKLIYAISLSLILITLFTPRFSIRDGSLKLAQLTSEQDYVIGLEGHQLSYNAKYHPVWWWPNKYDTINNEFVKKVRPKYLIVIIKQWGKEVENGWPMPRERMLDHIGASSLEKIYTSGLYSIFGRYGYEYEVYKIIY